MTNVRVGLVCLQGVEVFRNRSHILVDRPFIIIQYDDEALGRLCDIIERLKGRSTGECGIACYRDYMLVVSLEVSSCRHSKGCGQGSASVTSSVAIMFRFRTKQKPIEALVLSDGINLASSAGQHFVNVTLVGYVHHKSVNRRIENLVEGDS